MHVAGFQQVTLSIWKTCDVGTWWITIFMMKTLVLQPPFCLVNVFTSAFGVCLWDGVGPFISQKRLLVTSVCWLLINLRKFWSVISTLLRPFGRIHLCWACMWITCIPLEANRVKQQSVWIGWLIVFQNWEYPLLLIIQMANLRLIHWVWLLVLVLESQFGPNSLELGDYGEQLGLYYVDDGSLVTSSVFGWDMWTFTSCFLDLSYPSCRHVTSFHLRTWVIDFLCGHQFERRWNWFCHDSLQWSVI